MPCRFLRVGRWLAALGIAVLVGLRPAGVWASVTFNSDVSVWERYSDNVFFSPTDRTADVATVVVPSLALVFEGKDVTLTGSYGLTAEYHRVEKDANGITQNVGLDLDLPLLSRQSKRVDVRVRENMIYTTELPAFGGGDGGGESNQGIQVPRTDTFRNTASAAVTYGWSHRLRTALSYENVLTRYFGDFQDETVHSGRLDTSYQKSPRTGVGFGLGVSRQDYEGANSVTSWDTTVQAGHHVTPTTSVDGRVGIAITTASGQSATEFTEWVFDVSVNKTLETVTARAGYLREIGSGAGLVASATISDRVTGRATWNFSRRASADVGLAWANNVSTESTTNPALKIQTYAGATAISVGLADWLSVSASYSHLTQTAKGSVGSDGSRNVVMLTLTATGPSRRLVK